MFVVIEPDAHFPWTVADTLDIAAAKLRGLMLEDARRWGAAGLMTYEAYEAEHDARYLSEPAREIPMTEWFEMLGALPPLAWTTDQGVERFNMSEFMSGAITSQYARYRGRAAHRYVRHGDRATYMTPTDFARLRAAPLQDAKVEG